MENSSVRIAADILIAAISTGNASGNGATETKAKEIAKAFEIIHQAVLDAESKKNS